MSALLLACALAFAAGVVLALVFGRRPRRSGRGLAPPALQPRVHGYQPRGYQPRGDQPRPSVAPPRPADRPLRPPPAPPGEAP